MNPASPRLSLPLWNERYAAPLAPTTAAEMRARGWDYVDVVFVTGDAYVDHPSFAMAILARVLEAAGFRVAVLSQPDWHSCEPWRQFGRPRLFFAVSAGNMDSLINHYTANKKVRNDDAYSPGGRIGLRPTAPRCPIATAPARRSPACRSSPAASRRRCAGWPITTTGATPSAVRSCSTARPTCSSTAWARRRSSRSPAVSRPARRSRTCATCAAWPMCWGRRSRKHYQPGAPATGPTRRWRSGLVASSFSPASRK